MERQVKLTPLQTTGRAPYTGTVQTQRAHPAGSADLSLALLPEISRAVRGLLPTSLRAVLLGSRATGAAGPRSDWDIGITGPAPVDGAILERIREALENLPTLATFDVVDLAVVPEGFRERALEEGMTL
jgi:predicted nucleotidyltransferase